MELKTLNVSESNSVLSGSTVTISICYVNAKEDITCLESPVLERLVAGFD